jgi:hypothetical protein
MESVPTQPAITHLIETKPVTTVVHFIVWATVWYETCEQVSQIVDKMWRDTISHQQAQMSG